ncbi:ABC transporter ATP-binding protein [Lederbergia sp. NSJ-179]|uniref:ABC transporter ATP-binding protein n=1 Tax=Lederbergia sp. NSJ-179 TaxID=2931402 RepID=UPI001FD56C37|nr:ABC transporter ATP-binding protein [Lederbergia sp. NSJ-179]MCJ7843137.1 ABC transporter ATP-binding protein [Lederbergia sp. NSJ-179]
MTIILKAFEITKSYTGNHMENVLQKTNLSFEQGTINVIKGKSGSGKSTFLGILGGMENPSKGKVYYKNESFYDLPDSEQAVIRGEKFGFVFQSFQLIPELTVRENIELPLRFIHKKNSTSEIRIEELANELGIISQLDKRPSLLSGGEQQRVAIARALITNPEILFADEPTGNLDETTSKSIVNILTKLNNEKNLTLIVVTHEQTLFNAPHLLYSLENGLLEVSYNNV